MTDSKENIYRKTTLIPASTSNAQHNICIYTQIHRYTIIAYIYILFFWISLFCSGFLLLFYFHICCMQNVYGSVSLANSFSLKLTVKQNGEGVQMPNTVTLNRSHKKQCSLQSLKSAWEWLWKSLQQISFNLPILQQCAGALVNGSAAFTRQPLLLYFYANLYRQDSKKKRK